MARTPRSDGGATRNWLGRGISSQADADMRAKADRALPQPMS